MIKKLLQTFVGLYMVIIVFTLVLSCNKSDDGIEENEQDLAGSVVNLQFINGKASKEVVEGDIIAVYSTASDTTRTFGYTIWNNREGSSLTNKKMSVNPGDLQVSNVIENRLLKEVKFSSNSEFLNEEYVSTDSTEIFWTWDLSDLSVFPDIPSVQFTGILKASGQYCDIFVDENSTLITNEIAGEIASQFDQVGYPVVTQQFGNPPIVNGSSRLTILLPLAFNGSIEQEPNPNGFSFGAFNDMDQYPPSTENPYSNYRNVLYLNIGAVNTGNPDYENRWRSILSHEFQHMVNFNYHGLSEAVAIDEGKALLSEMLSGYGLTGGDMMMWVNVDLYQQHPESVSLLQDEYAPDNPMGTYGMGLLWVCYLYDRFGEEMLYQMATCDLPGLEGAEAVTGVSKEQLFTDWVQTNILSGIERDPVYNYFTIDVEGDGDGQYYQSLEGFAARADQVIPGTETQRYVHSYGVEYLAVDASGVVNISGENINALLIKKDNK